MFTYNPETMLPKILLVDDEEEILDFLERTLKSKYTILRAEDGQAALKVLGEQAIQLVVSDVMMPEIDGMELCRTIKSSLDHAHIPVILLTAKNTLQAKVEGLELGADAYIEKPFSKEHLQAQIASLIANRSMIREYFASSPLAHIKRPEYSKADERFVEALKQTIFTHLEDITLDVEKLAAYMNMTRTTLYRKIKALTELSPVEFINRERLKKAAELLSSGEYKIYEVADMAGFSSQSNFARSFQKQFGMSPTSFVQQQLEKRAE